MPGPHGSKTVDTQGLRSRRAGLPDEDFCEERYVAGSDSQCVSLLRSEILAFDKVRLPKSRRADAQQWGEDSRRHRPKQLLGVEGLHSGAKPTRRDGLL